jgi:hypothetical protein
MDKQIAWDYALGLIQIDGLTPTPEFLELANKEIRGEITLEEIEKRLNKRYRVKENNAVMQ